MAVPTKTPDIFFQFGGAAIVEAAANTVSKSTELNVATIFLARLFIDMAPTGTGGITVGPELSIESTPFATGDAGWRPIISPYVFDVATPASSAVDGTEAAGSTLIEESSTGTLALSNRVFFKNSTLQNSEWGKVVGLSTNTSFTLLDGLTNAQTGSTWFNLAQYFTPLVDLSATIRIRAVLNNNTHGTARGCACRVGMVQLSSVS